MSRMERIEKAQLLVKKYYNLMRKIEDVLQEEERTENVDALLAWSGKLSVFMQCAMNIISRAKLGMFAQ